MSIVAFPSALCSAQPFVSIEPPARASQILFQQHGPRDPERTDIEHFVAEVYRRHFGARLTHFMPMLVSRSADGITCAAAGFRSADEPLFLERYLPQPVERMLGDAIGQPVERRHIVEVGQFASHCPGEGRRLMLALARHLVDAGFRWAVITATAELRRLFRHQGLTALPLGIARQRCLGDEARLWGSYYRHAPRVLAGDLALNLARLERGRR